MNENPFSIEETKEVFFSLKTVFKANLTTLVENYGLISVLPFFSKILERIIYNCLYKYLIHNKILHSKQFGFQKGHFTEHVIVHLTSQLLSSFEENKLT